MLRTPPQKEAQIKAKKKAKAKRPKPSSRYQFLKGKRRELAETAHCLCENVGVLPAIEPVFKFPQITKQVLAREFVELAYHAALEQ
jgi:hypothetical protein